MLVTDNTAICKRPQVPFPQILLAEHGLSCFIKVCSGEKEHSILMDAAVTPACLLNNANLLKVELKKIGAIVLSHGHPDHFLGLLELLGTASKEQNKKIPLFLHPDAFLERRMNIPAIGHPISIPAFDEGTLKEAGANIVKSEISSSIANDLIYTRGEIERAIDLKKDFPGLKQKLMKNGYLISSDDQSLVIKLKDKGLVIVSGCAQAGIINTVRHAKKITGTNKVHAVLGGFHLTGKIFDPIIQSTIDEMKKINPDFVVPMHCTSWKAINRFAEEMQEQFLLNTVGTTYIFKSIS